jgi:hypothetical protein
MSVVNKIDLPAPGSEWISKGPHFRVRVFVGKHPSESSVFFSRKKDDEWPGYVDLRSFMSMFEPYAKQTERVAAEAHELLEFVRQIADDELPLEMVLARARELTGLRS